VQGYALRTVLQTLWRFVGSSHVLRRCYRQKDGKRHGYWALVESYRTSRGPRQRVVAYLGEMDAAGRLGLHQRAAGPAALAQRRLFEDVEPQWVEVDLKRIAVNGNGRKVEINEEKIKNVDLAKGGSFTFLGFEYRRILGRNRKWRAYYAPKLKKRTALLAKLKATAESPASRISHITWSEACR
jgi:hypothetical protein